ncbi:YncE family protein, partial [Bacillus cereus]|uniref:YncE family protein n=1 Tax=Bacillus cereus TaxID=1396 RepID=UPI000BED7384
NFRSDSVSVINTNSHIVVDTINVGSGPYGVAITPSGNFVYVTGRSRDIVFAIATNSNAVVETINVGWEPVGIAIS